MDGSPPPLVYRYTIDNCYDEGLISVAMAALLPGVEHFSTDPADWGEEDAIMISPKDFHAEIGAPADIDWMDLRAGQVYLRGRFEIEGDRDDPTGFRADETKAEDWLRVDNLSLIKDDLKRRYIDLLQRSASR